MGIGSWKDPSNLFIIPKRKNLKKKENKFKHKEKRSSDIIPVFLRQQVKVVKEQCFFSFLSLPSIIQICVFVYKLKRRMVIFNSMGLSNLQRSLCLCYKDFC